MLGDTCINAELINPPFNRTDSLAGYQADYSYGTGCDPHTGIERVYAVDVPAGQRLTVVATSMTSGFSLVTSIVRGPAAQCDAYSRSCLGKTVYTNASAALERVFLMVGGQYAFAGSGTYSLSLTLDTPAAADVCEVAGVLTPGTPISNVAFSAFANDYAATAGCGAQLGGADAVYRLTIPAGKRATVTAAPSAGDLVAVALVDAAAGCAPLSCLIDAARGSSQPSTVLSTNHSASPRDVLVIVDRRSGAAGTFSLSATLDDPPAGDACPTATPAPDAGDVVQASTEGMTNDFSGGGTGCPRSADSLGPDRVFSLDVPAGRRVTLTVSPDAGFDPSLALLPGPVANCVNGSRTCAVSSTTAASGQPETVRWFNGSASDQRVFAVVDSDGGTGGFGLGVAIDTPVVGDVCELAGAPITSNVQLNGLTTAGYANDYDWRTGFVCSGPAPDRVHEVIVPDGKLLEVYVFPSATYDPRVAIVPGPGAACARPSSPCLAASAGGGPGASELAQWFNHSGGPISVFVVVDSDVLNSTGTYALRVTFYDAPTPPPPGFQCWNPEPVCTGALPNQTTAGYGSDYAPPYNSGGGFDAVDRVYSVTLGPGQSLEASLIPTSQVTGLYVLEGPAAACGLYPTPLAMGTSSGFNVVFVTWWNSSPNTKTVFLVADHSSQPFSYNLNVTVF